MKRVGLRTNSAIMWHHKRKDGSVVHRPYKTANFDRMKEEISLEYAEDLGLVEKNDGEPDRMYIARVCHDPRMRLVLVDRIKIRDAIEKRRIHA